MTHRSRLVAYDVRGLPLACHAWGRPDAPVLMLLHGFLDHGEAFAPMAERLADRFHVLAPDFRGHGQSGWIGAGGYYHFHDYHFDIVALVRHLNLGAFALVGHSMGGMVAAGVAALLPEHVQALVLLEGMGPPAQAAEVALERLGHWVAALQAPGMARPVAERRLARRPMAHVEAAAARLARANPRLAPDRALALARTSTERIAADSAEVVWRHDPLHRTPGSRPFRVDEAATYWRALRIPVLSVLAGQSDWAPPDLAERHACLAAVTVATVPEAGHNLHHEQPERLADAVAAWLATPGPVPAALAARAS